MMKIYATIYINHHIIHEYQHVPVPICTGCLGLPDIADEKGENNMFH